MESVYKIIKIWICFQLSKNGIKLFISLIVSDSEKWKPFCALIKSERRLHVYRKGTNNCLYTRSTMFAIEEIDRHNACCTDVGTVIGLQCP